MLFELTPLLLNTLAACALTLLAAGLLLGAVKEVKDFLAIDAEPEVLGQCNMMLLPCPNSNQQQVKKVQAKVKEASKSSSAKVEGDRGGVAQGEDEDEDEDGGGRFDDTMSISSDISVLNGD